MRIGIAYLEYSRRKGIERASAELADRIAQRGHEVHVHCTKWENASSSPVRFHKVYTLNVVNSSKILTFAILGKASLNGRQYDVTHSSGSVIGCDVITAHSCHRAGMRIARTVISSRIKARANFGVADRLRLFLEHENYGKRKYVRVIACSSLVKSELMCHYAVPENDIVVVPNGVDTQEFHPRNRELFAHHVRSALQIRIQDIVLLFVGHEFDRKGLETIIRSVAALKDKGLKLLVCGGDPPEKFQGFARTLGVGKQVIFLGAQTDVKKFYAAADVFVLPTLHEAFGLVITEAMASGLPVIVSRTAGAAEDIIEDGKDGILLSDPLSSEELAEKIRMLVEDTTLREKIGARACARIQEFTWDACVERVLRVFEEVRHSKSS